MRKISVLLAVIICCVVLSSCNFDPYYGKRPIDYGAAKWVCEEPEAIFIVDPEAEDYYSPKGEVCWNDEALPIQFFFVHETNRVLVHEIVAENSDKEPLEFDGDGEFSEYEFIMHIDKEKDTFFEGQYDTLTFKRTDLE